MKRGELFFSGTCNFNCFYCIREEIGEKVTTSKYERLDEWIELLKSEDVTHITVSSYNCEPTKQPRFKEICQKLFDNGFELELRTNGTSFVYAELKNNADFWNQFNIIWLSLNGQFDSTAKQITGRAFTPNLGMISNLLSKVELRCSIVVNRYNSLEIQPLIESAPSAIKIWQVRKLHQENGTEDFEIDRKAFDTVKAYIKNRYASIANSVYDEYWVYGKCISFWSDVLEDEIGLKYFPASEIITSVGRIVPLLKK